MRKLILGIVAVFCVQIMFQVFTAVDLSDAGRRARLAQGPLVGPVSNGNAVEIADLPEEGEKLSTEVVAAANSSQVAVLRRRPNPDVSISTASYSRPNSRPTPRRINRAALVAMAEPPATPDVFAPQVISYPAYMSARDSTRSEKRSFFAKVLPVIKKPYDLLKAVGSRLK